ncbi:hypothetical protein Ccrd_000998 [Cynara cardunculus var. scolymus]|uniref:Uncharacterized protein n=1 Tax=Cynara cardunculus var. scolymus TaxID=59895 RepID=A0A103XU26_CYNCS|nr:hypothetical protein Ccrd_000998 [Cynara cardunculus var. scolymus]
MSSEANVGESESILANKHNPYTHLGAPLPAYPYKTRVGGSRSYEVPTPSPSDSISLLTHPMLYGKLSFPVDGYLPPEDRCHGKRGPLDHMKNSHLLYSP